MFEKNVDPGENLLSIWNVSKKFGNTIALKQVSLQIKRGECLVILGPSGAGKTTTLKVIAGLEYADEGTIVLSGELINELEPQDRNMAMVFESYALYPNQSVFNNIASSLYALKWDNEEITKKVHEITKLLGIFPYLDRKPGNLSGGQRQRVALGRALVKPASLYLMDEPIAHLDAKLRYQMIGEFKHLLEELNISLLYVTHDWREAMSLGNTIVVLNNGKIEQYGTKQEIFNKPKNTFVARIVGDPPMNMINGVIENKKMESYFRAEGIDIPLPDKMEECEAVLGIRPSKLRIQDSGKSPFYAEVYSSGKHGLNDVISLKIGDKIYKTEYKGGKKFEIGKSVPFNIDIDGACLFNKEEELITVIEGIE